MTLHPFFADWLPKLPPGGLYGAPETDVAERRRAANAGLAQALTTNEGQLLAGVDSVDRIVEVEDGTVGVRLYRPAATTAALPAHLYIHGGAFWMGNVEQSGPLCAFLARTVPCVVASIDYRLAPEAPFPIPLEDCYAALCWLAAHAGELGVDPARITVGGSSAGGNLAAATALLARDRGGPALAGQIIDIPCTDPELASPSMRSYGSGFLLTRDSMREGWDYYLPHPEDRHNPYAALSCADDLEGLPPAMVIIAEYDPLCDEGLAYGRRLEAAGVPTTIDLYTGMIHGFSSFLDQVPEARYCLQTQADWLRCRYRLCA